jgi:alkylmercury lyase
MTTDTKEKSPIEKVVANLKAIGLPPNWDSATNGLVASLYREIAKGDPIAPDAVDRMITESGLELEEGRAFVAGVSERDEEGSVLGSVGLSQNQHAHEFRVDGVELTTWCAWDTLFIAQVLGKTASVTSRAPGTYDQITLEIHPSGATADPSETVVSFVLLDPEQIDMESLESVYMVFCQQIHFFPSGQAAEEWSGNSDYDFAILSVDEAFQVGSRAFASLIEAARN